MRPFHVTPIALLALLAAGCNCAVPKFPCANDRECPDTYSCVASVCEACPVCDDGQRCVSGACVNVGSDRLVFLSTCSQELQLGVQDPFGAAVTVASDTPIALASTVASLNFFSDDTCSTQISAITLGAGSSEVPFYVRDTATGSRIVTASSPSLANATQNVIVTAGAPTALAFSTAPVAANVGSCSPAIGIAVRDALGNATTVVGVTPVVMSSTPATLAWFSDATCSTPAPTINIAAGSGSRLVYFRGSAAGPTTASISASGLTPADQLEQVNPAPATVLAFTSAPQTLPAGGCSAAATVETRDFAGTPTAPAADLSVALTANTAMRVVTAGTTTASFFFKDGVVGMRQISAGAPGYTAANQNATITAGPPAKLAILGAGQTLLASTCSQAVAVETEVAGLLDAAERVVNAGLHLHLDKPAGESLPQFQRILETATKHQKLVKMGYMFRYNPAFQLMMQAVREGWLGRVFAIHAEMSKLLGDGERLALVQYQGGSMFELGCHLIDSVVRVLGKPDKVMAHARKTRADGWPDNMLAVLEYKDATVSLRSSMVEVDGGSRRQFVVCGEYGTIEIRPLEPAGMLLTLDRPRGIYKMGRQEVKFDKVPRYAADWEDFAKAIRGEVKWEFTPEHDLVVQETVLRAAGMMK